MRNLHKAEMTLKDKCLIISSNSAAAQQMPKSSGEQI